MVQRTGQQGVPVIAVDDQYIVGFDQPRLEQALARGSQARPVFGASIADAASQRAGTIGAFVGRVRPGSAAQRAGLLAGDVVVEMAGKPLRTADDFQAVLATQAPGSAVNLVYVRNGERRTAMTKL
jgi:S1-C subfamily serine protease